MTQPTDALDAAWDQLEGIFAYDMGAIDSGTRDERLRNQLVAELDAHTEDEIRLSLSRWLRDGLLSEAAISAGYGWEDVLAFAKWIDSGEYKRP